MGREGRERGDERKVAVKSVFQPAVCCRGLLVLVPQVLEKLELLQAERDRLEQQWNQKQHWLGTVHLEQVFYRDVNSMDKMSSSQEVHACSLCCREENLDCQCLTAEPPQILLQNSTLGETADEAEGLIKRHDAFEKLLSLQDEKVCLLFGN